MRKYILLIFSLSYIIINAQTPRHIDKEFERNNINTIFLIPSQAIDEYILWSDDENLIYFNEQGKWYKKDLNYIFTIKAKWQNKTIGRNIVENRDMATLNEISALKSKAKFNPRKITTQNGKQIELVQNNFSIEFTIDNKVIWKTQGENCHSLTLSPSENYVSFISELNGIMIYKIENISLTETEKLVNNAINSIIKGNTKYATKLLDKILIEDSLNSEVYYWKSFIEFDKKNYEAAITFINKSIKINAHNPFYYFYLANIYKYIKNYSICIENIKKYIEILPQDLYGYYYLGEIFLEINENEKACENFKIAQTLGSKKAIEKLKNCKN